MKSLIKEIQPWKKKVDGAGLLNEVNAAIGKYLVVPTGATEAITLWIAHTYVYDAKNISPNLVFSSPEKRCGKTTAITLLSELVHSPILASNITAAAIFRVIEKYKPTLIIDEADAYLKNDEDMRAIINSSHNKNSAFVFRVEGEKTRDPVPFSTWAPIAIAGIGSVADTIADRSIIMPMRRKLPGEKVTPLSPNTPELEILSQKMKRWADDNIKAVEKCMPVMPSELNDRAADNWRILFAIAECAGGNWPNHAKQCALLFSVDEEDSDDSLGTKLLADLKFVFKDKDKLSSSAICEGLNKIEESGWQERNYGKGITPSWLARLLSAYSIKSRDIRFGSTHGNVLKGYAAQQFQDAFDRYLPKIPATPQQSNVGVASGVAPVAPIEEDDDGEIPF